MTGADRTEARARILKAFHSEDEPQQTFVADLLARCPRLVMLVTLTAYDQH